MGSNSYLTTDLLEKVLCKVYEKHERPKLVHYEEAVAELKCKKEKLPHGSYTKRQVHTSVWRAMKILVDRGDIIQDGKYFYGRAEYDDYCGKHDFKKYVYPASPEFQFISENTVAINLECVDDHEKINKAVVKKFGEDKVFTSFVCDKVLIIVFRKDTLDNYLLSELLVSLSEAYKYHVLKEKNDQENQ